RPAACRQRRRPHCRSRRRGHDHGAPGGPAGAVSSTLSGIARPCGPTCYNETTRRARSHPEVPEPSSKSVPEVATELWSLTKDYARQETIEPLKGVGRYVAFGFAGAVLGAFGVAMLLLSLLRALQTETD